MIAYESYVWDEEKKEYMSPTITQNGWKFEYIVTDDLDKAKAFVQYCEESEVLYILPHFVGDIVRGTKSYSDVIYWPVSEAPEDEGAVLQAMIFWSSLG